MTGYCPRSIPSPQVLGRIADVPSLCECSLVEGFQVMLVVPGEGFAVLCVVT
jgi:hypothetical protein